MSVSTKLFVDGLTCGHCVASVREELEEVQGVKNVVVTLNNGGTSSVVVISDNALDEDALRDAIAEAGYTLKGIERN